MFYVIQIGRSFFRTFYGVNYRDSEIQTGSAVLADRFECKEAAEIAAALLRENKMVRAKVRVRKCVLAD